MYRHSTMAIDVSYPVRRPPGCADRNIRYGSQSTHSESPTAGISHASHLSLGWRPDFIYQDNEALLRTDLRWILKLFKFPTNAGCPSTNLWVDFDQELN